MTMAGSARLGTNLIDQLTPMIDSLRGSLHPMFGVRPFRVYATLWTWGGQVVGEGDGYIDQTIEITPQPRIEQWDGYRWVMTPAGVNENGLVRMSEVSLSYTHAEIAGGKSIDGLLKNQQFFFRLVDAYGNENEERLLRHSRPPYVDREKTMGWVCWLTNMNVEDGQMPELPDDIALGGL